MNTPITHKEELAWNFAKELHEGQIRKTTGLPYFDEHVAKVNGRVKLYTKDESILIATLLHDTLEDCLEKLGGFVNGYQKIKTIFGKEVADIVVELTTDKDILKTVYDNNKQEYILHKMKNMRSKALTAKLSDRLENLSDGLTDIDGVTRVKYAKQTIYILERLDVRNMCNSVKSLYNDTITKSRNIVSLREQKA